MPLRILYAAGKLTLLSSGAIVLPPEIRLIPVTAEQLSRRGSSFIVEISPLVRFEWWAALEVRCDLRSCSDAQDAPKARIETTPPSTRLQFTTALVNHEFNKLHRVNAGVQLDDLSSHALPVGGNPFIPLCHDFEPDF